MRFACAFDHAGVPLREVVFAAVREAGHEPLDLGTDDDQTPDDYPDRALAVARAIRGGEAERGDPLLRLGRRGRGCRLEGRRDPRARWPTTPTPPASASSTTTSTCSRSAPG